MTASTESGRWPPGREVVGCRGAECHRPGGGRGRRGARRPSTFVAWQQSAPDGALVGGEGVGVTCVDVQLLAVCATTKLTGLQREVDGERRLRCTSCLRIGRVDWRDAGISIKKEVVPRHQQHQLLLALQIDNGPEFSGRSPRARSRPALRPMALTNGLSAPSVRCVRCRAVGRPRHLAAATHPGDRNLGRKPFATLTTFHLSLKEETQAYALDHPSQVEHNSMG